MNSNQAKVLTMVSLGISSVFAGLLPVWFIPNRNTSASLFLSSLLCSGSGILFATAMVHMLPEVHENLAKYAEIIACAGFLLLYFIEELISAIKGKAKKKCDNIHELSFENYGSVSHRQSPYNPDVAETNSLLVTRCSCEGDGSVCHVNELETKSASHIGLLLALGSHALLEGLAVGVQTIPSQILILGGAIASHKLIVAFCLGMELVTNSDNSKLNVVSAVFIFAFSSVVGIGIGMIVTEESVLANIENVVPILQGLAVGTLLYVTLAEVLPRERHRFYNSQNPMTGMVQFFSMLIGFGIMTSVTLFIDPHHEVESP